MQAETSPDPSTATGARTGAGTGLTPSAGLRRDRSRSGATIVEFALISVPFFALLFAIIDTALVFFATLTMENGMTEVARLVRTGQVQDGAMTETQFRDLLCAEIDMLVPCNEKLLIDVRAFDDFANIDPGQVTDANGDLILTPQFDPGAPGDVVLVRVFYSWPVMDLLIAPALSNQSGGTRLLATAAVFRNEPFGALLPIN